jgi:hypothetical protein
MCKMFLEQVRPRLAGGAWGRLGSRPVIVLGGLASAAIPGGEHLPSSLIKARTRQVMAFVKAQGRLPADVFELEPVPRTPRMLLLAACDAQQATIERHESDPRRALLRLQLPVRLKEEGFTHRSRKSARRAHELIHEPL